MTMAGRPEHDFVDSGVKVGAAPYLGPIVMDDKGVIQLIRAQYLLNDNVRELLFASEVEMNDEAR